VDPTYTIYHISSSYGTAQTCDIAQGKGGKEDGVTLYGCILYA